MAAVHSSAGAIHLIQIFTSAFLAILFLQSGIDKIVDRSGNFEWLKGHFAKSPLAGVVPALLICITILEVAAGALSAIGCVLVILSNDSTIAFYGAILSAAAVTCVIFWAASREGIRWCRSACSLLSAHTGGNLSPCAGINE